MRDHDEPPSATRTTALLLALAVLATTALAGSAAAHDDQANDDPPDCQEVDGPYVEQFCTTIDLYEGEAGAYVEIDFGHNPNGDGPTG